MTYFPALWLWIKISREFSHMPRGGVLGDQLGDVKRLQDIYG